MADPQPQPEIRARSLGALPHRDLDRLDVDELELLHRFLADVREAIDVDELAKADRYGLGLLPVIEAALVTTYRRIGFRRRADRVIVPLTDAHPGLRSGDIYHGVGFVGPRCESPVCPGPHDVGGRHPAGWSV